MVAQVRRIYRIRAVGHTGTLDPFATGLLVLLVGRATRLARFVSSQAKTYLATASLGVRTTTDDATGDPIGERTQAAVSSERIEAALAHLAESRRQRPPAFSAKQVGGERSYRLARRGEPVTLEEITITVHHMALIDVHDGEITFRTTVSAGTYIRALARDLGERLGVGAHLTALRREAIGALRVEDAIALDQLEPDTPLLSPRAVLGHLPSVDVDPVARERVSHGQAIPAPDGDLSGFVQVVSGDSLVAVASAREGVLHPTVVLPSS